jgi:hypothetical protein
MERLVVAGSQVQKHLAHLLARGFDTSQRTKPAYRLESGNRSMVGARQNGPLMPRCRHRRTIARPGHGGCPFENGGPRMTQDAYEPNIYPTVQTTPSAHTAIPTTRASR